MTALAADEKMNHLETLVREYLEWQGYLVRTNIKINRRSRGGYAMELDIVGYEPKNKTIVHYEPSIDGDSWKERERRFEKKFRIARENLHREIFPWLEPDVPIEQIAIVVTRGKRTTLGGGTLKTVDEFIGEVRDRVTKEGPAQRNAISETYPLLRTIQFLCKGYNKTTKGSS